MSRATRGEVESAVRAYVLAGKAVGVIGDGATFELQVGSPTNGRAWRLFTSGMESAPATGDRGYIGWTAAEAAATLWAISRAWWEVQP